MINKYEINKVSVIGAGILGHSIAQKFAMVGYAVVLNDLSYSILTKAKNNIINNIEILNEAGVCKAHPQEILNNIHFVENLNDAISDADLIIEAVPEERALKNSIFKVLDTYSSSHTILASNSSSLVPDDYAIEACRKEQIVGMHFFNPPYLLPLVEIVRGSKTSDETIDAIKHLLTKTNMHPIVIDKLSAGFIGNRLQFALLNEALKIVEEGIAPPEDIDAVVKYGFGRRLAACGPFEIFDFGGWDTIAKVQENITGKINPQIILEKIDQGHFGVKSGKGFYDWDENKIQAKKRLLTKVLMNIEKSILT